MSSLSQLIDQLIPKIISGSKILTNNFILFMYAIRKALISRIKKIKILFTYFLFYCFLSLSFSLFVGKYLEKALIIRKKIMANPKPVAIDLNHLISVLYK